MEAAQRKITGPWMVRITWMRCKPDLIDVPERGFHRRISRGAGQYDAEYGRSSSGQINVITRSGTSAFHGNLYEFLRNDVLNANSFSITEAPFRGRPSGTTISAERLVVQFYPQCVQHRQEKTFFFFSEEVRRVLTYSTFVPVLPSQANLNGNFQAARLLEHLVFADGDADFSRAIQRRSCSLYQRHLLQAEAPGRGKC